MTMLKSNKVKGPSINFVITNDFRELQGRIWFSDADSRRHLTLQSGLYPQPCLHNNYKNRPLSLWQNTNSHSDKTVQKSLPTISVALQICEHLSFALAFVHV